jgi:galactokinase
VALETPGVIGARLTGAGFGGCAVALVAAGQAEAAATTIAQGYQQATKRTGHVYICTPSAGAHAYEIAEAR